MLGTISPTTVASLAVPPGTEELAEAVIHRLGRRAGEEVRCVRVYGDCYRCNWWQRSGSIGGKITRSSFLRIVQTADGLVISELNSD